MTVRFVTSSHKNVCPLLLVKSEFLGYNDWNEFLQFHFSIVKYYLAVVGRVRCSSCNELGPEVAVVLEDPKAVCPKDLKVTV